MLSEAIQQQLQARYEHGIGKTKKAFMLSEAFEGWVRQLEEREAYSTVAFIDIADFSTKTRGYTATAVRKYLDPFYELALPEIYKNRGRVDRIIGDGVVAVFSEFFEAGVGNSELDSRVLATARAIVKASADTDHPCKAAVTSGELLFCRTGVADIYQDFTVIGRPLTEVYRMEDIAGGMQVVLPKNSGPGSLIEMELLQKRLMTPGRSAPSPGWTYSEQSFNFKGLGKTDCYVIDRTREI